MAEGREPDDGGNETIEASGFGVVLKSSNTMESNAQRLSSATLFDKRG
jgi:hypothetical protein